MSEKTAAFRKGFTLVETLIAAVVVGLLIALAIGVAGGVARTSKEKAIRKNLQVVWKTANMYFVETEKTEVSLPDLEKSATNGKAIAQLTPVAGENYSTINGGKITTTDKKLEISFGDDGKKIIYETE